MRTTSVAPGTTLDPESQELLQRLKSSGRRTTTRAPACTRSF